MSLPFAVYILSTIATSDAKLLLSREQQDSDKSVLIWAIVLGTVGGCFLIYIILRCSVPCLRQRKRSCSGPIHRASSYEISRPIWPSIADGHHFHSRPDVPHSFTSSTFDFSEKGYSRPPTPVSLARETNEPLPVHIQTPKPVLMTTIPSARLSYYAIHHGPQKSSMIRHTSQSSLGRDAVLNKPKTIVRTDFLAEEVDYGLSSTKIHTGTQASPSSLIPGLLSTYTAEAGDSLPDLSDISSISWNQSSCVRPVLSPLELRSIVGRSSANAPTPPPTKQLVPPPDWSPAIRKLAGSRFQEVKLGVNDAIAVPLGPVRSLSHFAQHRVDRAPVITRLGVNTDESIFDEKTQQALLAFDPAYSGILPKRLTISKSLKVVDNIGDGVDESNNVDSANEENQSMKHLKGKYVQVRRDECIDATKHEATRKRAKQMRSKEVRERVDEKYHAGYDGFRGN